VAPGDQAISAGGGVATRSLASIRLALGGGRTEVSGRTARVVRATRGARRTAAGTAIAVAGRAAESASRSRTARAVAGCAERRCAHVARARAGGVAAEAVDAMSRIAVGVRVARLSDDLFTSAGRATRLSARARIQIRRAHDRVARAR